VLLNTKLVAELIAQGDIGGVKEAMEKSLAEGSLTFEADLARLITEGTITREEGLVFSDSPTNLLWRLANDTAPLSRQPPKAEETDQSLFTEIVLDVRPEVPKSSSRFGRLA
jgi:twitching motility protein PilU